MSFLRSADQRLRFVVEEAGGADILGEFVLRSGGHGGDGWIFLEQTWRDFVHPFVCTLRRKNGGSQEVPRRL